MQMSSLDNRLRFFKDVYILTQTEVMPSIQSSICKNAIEVQKYLARTFAQRSIFEDFNTKLSVIEKLIQVSSTQLNFHN